MATHTSTVPAVLDALKALLDARAGLDGVTVTTAPSGDPIPAESIQFFGTNGDQAWAAIGNRRRSETYTIRGGIFIQRRGAGQAVWDAARERAYAILAELEDAIRALPTLGLADRVVVQLARVDLDQGGQDNGRWAALDIDIGVTAELVSS